MKKDPERSAVRLDVRSDQLNIISRITKEGGEFASNEIRLRFGLSRDQGVLAGQIFYDSVMRLMLAAVMGPIQVGDQAEYKKLSLDEKLNEGDQPVTFSNRSLSEFLSAGQRKQVIGLVAQGKSNREIRDILHVSRSTVARHLRAIRIFGGFIGRSELVAYCNQFYPTKEQQQQATNETQPTQVAS